uniref:Na+/H+ antiporter NhaA n=1 Tax=Rhodococcus qingshengii TaxID=334542 RepID=UPI001C4E2B28
MLPGASVQGSSRSRYRTRVLLLIAAATALIWANTPWSDAYDSLRDFTVGPSSLHLNLSLG